jgi:hypothetical protein
MTTQFSDDLLVQNQFRAVNPYDEQYAHQLGYEGFQRVFAIRPGDRVLILADRGLDPRVIQGVWAHAAAKGASVNAFVAETVGHVATDGGYHKAEIPEYVKPLISDATFVVSTWAESTSHPFFRGLRKNQGQRWVKITYFRNWDILKSAQARFPVELVSELLVRTARLYPASGPATIHVTDPRGTDLTFKLTERYVKSILNQSRWQGQLTADVDGCYVHYLPTHGPNLYNHSSEDWDSVEVDGVLRPQWGVAFPRPFDDPPSIVIKGKRVSSVEGDGSIASTLREMIIGATIVELGCGFNPKARRLQIFPAGSNSPGALHFGIDTIEEQGYLKANSAYTAHLDLIDFDGTVTINDVPAVDAGRLTVLDDPDLRELATRFGDPDDLLNNWPL